MSPSRPGIDIAAVAARTMLCTLSTSAWRATRLHKKETQESQKKHHSSAPRVLVTVCDHKALAELACLHAQAYTEHRRLTLPSVQDGMRLIPAGRQLEHADKMSALRDQHEAIVSRFLSDYEAEAAAAPSRLNGLYDASMWPTLDNVRNRFSFGSRYLACPTEGAWGEWLAESVRGASDELAERLREALERVRDRCASDGKLFASVFDQLRDIVQLVPDLDLSGSPVLQSVAAKAGPLAGHSAELLREDKAGRADVARQAGAILTMLGGIS